MLKWDDISSLWPNAPQSELFVGCLVRSIISIRCDMRSGYPPAANVGGHYAKFIRSGTVTLPYATSS